MSKVIDTNSDKEHQIRREIEDQVRAELGLTEMRWEDLSLDDILKYKEAFNSRCENAGVNSTVSVGVLMVASRFLRERGEDEGAEVLEAIVRRGDN